MQFYNNLSPTIFSLGPLDIRWYGLIYVTGFVIAYIYLLFLEKKKQTELNREQIDEFIFYLLIGTIIGARLFYVIFYNFGHYLENPLSILALWQGGLSFHGGLAGAFVSGMIFCRKNKLSYLKLADILALPLAFGLFLGRIGNFINGELVGRITNVPWCFYFKDYEGCRHPSQLYESAKNLFIFFVLLGIKQFKKRKLPDGYLFLIFMAMYSVLRFFIEYVREPDTQLGFVIFSLTMGQLLNIVMFLVTVGVMVVIRKR